MSDNRFHRNEAARPGAFAWLWPLLIVVLVLGLSWAGVFVVVNDLVHAAFVEDASYGSER
jgi:hypothetical protein